MKIILPENADVSTMIAACNIAFRLGMETTGYEGGILADADYCGNAIILEDGDRAEMTLEETDEAVRVHLKGRGADLETLSALICEKFPGMGGFRQFRDVMMEMCDDAVLRNANGQIAALKAWKQKEEGAYIRSMDLRSFPINKKHFLRTSFLKITKQAGKHMKKYTSCRGKWRRLKRSWKNMFSRL